MPIKKNQLFKMQQNKSLKIIFVLLNKEISYNQQNKLQTTQNL